MAELEEAVSESLKLFNVVNIKQEQKRILDALTKNNDCMAIWKFTSVPVAYTSEKSNGAVRRKSSYVRY